MYAKKVDTRVERNQVVKDTRCTNHKGVEVARGAKWSKLPNHKEVKTVERNQTVNVTKDAKRA
jgi:hypothetical protein